MNIREHADDNMLFASIIPESHRKLIPVQRYLHRFDPASSPHYIYFYPFDAVNPSRAPSIEMPGAVLALGCNLVQVVATIPQTKCGPKRSYLGGQPFVCPLRYWVDFVSDRRRIPVTPNGLSDMAVTCSRALEPLRRIATLLGMEA